MKTIFTTFLIIALTILVSCFVVLGVIGFQHQSLSAQRLYSFIFDHENWKTYKSVKNLIQDETVPIMSLIDYCSMSTKDKDQFCQQHQYYFLVFGQLSLYHPICLYSNKKIALGSFYNQLMDDLLEDAGCKDQVEIMAAEESRKYEELRKKIKQ